MPNSTPIVPVGKVVYVADDVVRLPGSRKPSILNVWEVIRVPPDTSFPFMLGKLCVASWMRDGFGTVRFYVDIVDATTNTLIRRSSDYSYTFKDRLRSALVAIHLQNVSFPHAGYFLVELYCEGRFIDDQLIQVES